MRISDLQPGDALTWRGHIRDKAVRRNAVVVDIAEDKSSANIAMVYQDRGLAPCFDEPHAKYELHRNNVRLKHAPPPFGRLNCPVGRPIAQYDPDHPKAIDDGFFEANAVGYEDPDRALLDGRDVHTLRCHPWPEQYEKEKRYEDKGRSSSQTPNSLARSALMQQVVAMAEAAERNGRDKERDDDYSL